MCMNTKKNNTKFINRQRLAMLSRVVEEDWVLSAVFLTVDSLYHRQLEQWTAQH